MLHQNDVTELLDKCILLNTYLSHFFLIDKDIIGYEVDFRVDHFVEKQEMLLNIQSISFPDKIHPPRNSMYINELVAINSEAKKEFANTRFTNEFMEYNYVFTSLAKRLEKEVSGK